MAHTQAWDYEDGVYEPESKRQADVYVFALLDERDRERVEPRDLAQWVFFVVPTERLSSAVGDQRSVSLARVRELAPQEVRYTGLAAAVGACLARP